MYNKALEKPGVRYPRGDGSVPKTSIGRIPAPQGSTDCCPEVQIATATEYRLVSSAKQSNFIWGELVGGGKLSFIVENLPKTTPYSGCAGRWMFGQMMAHFGGNVIAIQGNWVGPNSDNLREVNRFTAAGLSLESAAKATWTGQRASGYGFTDYEEVSKLGMPGNYSDVHVLFKQ